MSYIVCSSCRTVYHNVDELINEANGTGKPVKCFECGQDLVFPEVVDKAIDSVDVVDDDEEEDNVELDDDQNDDVVDDDE